MFGGSGLGVHRVWRVHGGVGVGGGGGGGGSGS